MKAIGVLLLAGSLIQILISGAAAALILYVVLSALLILVSLKAVQKRIPGGIAVKAGIQTGIIFIFLVSGILLNPFTADNKIAAEYNKGMRLYNEGKYKAALEVFEKLENENKDNDQVLLAQGLVFMNMDNPEKAHEYYNKALRINPYDTNILYNISLSRYRTGNLQGALQGFEAVADKEPGLSKARLHAAVIAMELGNYPRASHHLSIAARINPGEPLIHYYLGKSHSALMEYKAAAEAYQRALDLKPARELQEIINEANQEILPFIGGDSK